MPSIQEWFDVYKGIKDAVANLQANLAGAQGALANIFAALTDPTKTGITAVKTEIDQLDATIKGSRPPVSANNPPLIFHGLDGINDLLANYIDPQLTILSGHIAAISENLGTMADTTAKLSDPVKALSLGQFPGFEGESADRLRDAITALGENKLNLKDLLAIILSVYSRPLMDATAPIPDAMRALEKAMTELTKEASPNLLAVLRKYYSGVGARLQKENDQIEAQTQADRERVVGYLVEKAESQITTGIEKGIKFARPLLNILEAPFSAIVTAALNEFTDAFTANKPADPQKARELVTVAITKAYQMGEAAHILSAAAELFQPLKQMGFPQLAAALGDLSGFKEISSSLSRTLVAGSITRPMRWWGNDVFSPEILQVRDLIELVQKREIDLTLFARVLYQHGFTHEDTDLLVKAVWREPSIRDLAIAIEDTTVEDDWLLQRVRRAGYEDNDAEQLTRSLTQRSLKAARGRVISAALANVTDGLLDTESYRAILESLQLRQDEIDLQIRTAELAARRDTVNTAITTYRKQYVNDGISRSDFTLALTALGVNPDRVDLIALDADAQRAPKIAREEEAKLKEAVREIQTELVPRYRRLYELGVIGDDAYQNILIEAGISPQVAAQAVLLDKQKRLIVTRTATATALERETARLVSETETALRLQYRKGLIDEGQLEASLLDLGYSDQRAQIIVNQEKARATVAPGREITAPVEAEDRVILDLQLQTALNDFRRGRIDALDLYDALIAQGIHEDEALARVNLEISRLPIPAAPT